MLTTCFNRAMQLRRAALLALLCITAALVWAPPAEAVPSWAPASGATIHPGVSTITAGLSQCTSNFVFYDDTDVYIGQAAHCSIAGDPLTASDPLSASGPNGCIAQSLPLGTPVMVGGATEPGTLVYNSWISMQEAGETDQDACHSNDFALVRLEATDHGRVNPSMPHWGGPTGLATSTNRGERVYSYGNSDLRLQIAELSPKVGVGRGQDTGGWNHTVFTLTPGIPGDSGSGYLNSQGQAFGVLSTLILVPQPAHNGVGDLSRALDYMRSHTELDGVQLANGTEPFSGSSPLDLAADLLNPVLDLLDIPLGLLGQLGL